MRANTFKIVCLNSQILRFVVSRSATFETGEKINLVSFAPSCFSIPVVRHLSKMLGRLRDGFVFERGENAFKNPFAVVAAEQRFAGAFGVRHGLDKSFHAATSTSRISLGCGIGSPRSRMSSMCISNAS